MPVLIVGYLGSPALRIPLAPDQGQGNTPGDIPLDKVPADLRMPNTALLIVRNYLMGEFWVTRDDDPYLPPREPDL
ncbi:hypothetical protein [Deinococcus sp.]|uniref:hypothetical protein n=1 Tax=Deinococcus sp. TaxID=47478 RepID=UPI002869A585|nr:hypothetical protein [Deinococcus sp.]